MRKEKIIFSRFIILLGLFLVIGCKNSNDKKLNNLVAVSAKVDTIKSENFKLVKAAHQKGTLVLFPCFPCDAQNTEEEFKVVDTAVKNGFSVLMMNFNMHLYLEEQEKSALSKELNIIFKTNQLIFDNTYIGGFSSGGNVSLLLSDYLMRTNSQIKPKGVFIADSPIDFLHLYKVSQMRIKSNPQAEEALFIINEFEAKFGKPEVSLNNYKRYSPFIFESETIENVKALKDIKLRFYTEPDYIWWKEHSGENPEDLNAFAIEKSTEQLKNNGFSKVELIKTQNKGYRANGDRHPHSWSIIDKENLIKWMLN